uniref:Uncharacterized protein n=1 Tax=Picea glauca TaxID=3330 RepID=A0A101LX79_PICGL|nr:hypothetical protein ABT39_MTgene6033 [Picea glauca]QHR86814.1 hypothetical protein Q903MT_gene821 [Picea sitchensis]
MDGSRFRARTPESGLNIQAMYLDLEMELRLWNVQNLGTS